MTSAWMLDERAYAGPEHLDPIYVATYDRKAGFDPAEDLAVLRRHGIGPDSTVVDLGPGTGGFALAVAPFVGQVVAVDVSPVMLDSLAAEAGLRGLANVTCVPAGFLSSPAQPPQGTRGTQQIRGAAAVAITGHGCIGRCRI